MKHLGDRRSHITKTKGIDGTAKEFIVDTGSMVTIMPPDKKIIKDKSIRTLKKTKLYSPERLR